jgi:rhodanese-related sulfurtransferase
MGGESDLQRAYFEAKLAATADVMDVVRFLDRDDGELVLLDARAGDAHAVEHLPGAISVPVDSAAEVAEGLDPTRQYVVYCWRSTCHLAAKVALELTSRGLDVREMNTGWREWKAQGWPTEGPDAP